jgi:hypothetical protein
MSRRTMVSALAVVGLLAVVALGQPPDSGQTKAKKTFAGPDGKKADPTDAAVKAALANDSDVQVARAKVLLAEAELAKAKQAVVLKVMLLQATIQEQKAAVEAARERVALAERMHKTSQMTQTQLLDERTKLESAQAALVRTETELKLLTGAGKEMGMEGAPGATDPTAEQALLWFSRRMLEGRALETTLHGYGTKTPVGAVPERIRAALDKPVKLGAKGEKVTFEKAMDVFKMDAGLDVPVRGKFPFILGKPPQLGDDKKIQAPSTIEIMSEGEELPVGAWFQLFEDIAVGTQPDYSLRRFHFYVRDYGLFITVADAAPANAPTLTEFWKQKPPVAKKGPKEVGEPEKKAGN